MQFDFESRVDRKNCGNLKELLFTPQNIREKGYVSFSGAEFEFKTARPVIDAVKAAAENGLFGFTVADENYLSHIVWWMREVRGVETDPQWILPVQGTIFSCATMIRLCTAPGEAVLVPSPGYNRYEQAATRLGRKTVFSPAVMRDGRPELDVGDLAEKMARPEVKLLVLCNPNNPTGRIIREDALRRILQLARENDVAVWSDEIFGDTPLDGSRVPVLAALAGEADNAVTVVSMGKTFSFTGVNHANVIIKNPALRAAYEAQRNADHFGSIDPMAYAALCGGYTPAGREWLSQMLTVVRQNNARIERFFAAHLPQVKVLKPEATYVLWVDFSGLGLPEKELFDFLYNEAYFCCDPGEEYYGAPCMARVCTAVPPHELERSLEAFLEAAEKRGFAR